MASAGGEIWLQWFACCYQPAAQAQRTRRRIDRSMIGNPTNFQHTGHIGKNKILIYWLTVDFDIIMIYLFPILVYKFMVKSTT